MPRILEIVITSLAALILAIPMVLTGCVVWITLGRPLLFSQTRAGKDLKSFEILKFRTMTDTRDKFGNLLPDDVRQTRTSWWLRRLRLDELPQLLAILRGDMALVGPRPLFTHTIQAFGKSGPVRCSVRPGLTGWSQVNGNVLLTNEEKLSLDLWYTGHRSLKLDLRIVFETVGVVLFGERKNPERLAQAEEWMAIQGFGDAAEDKK